MIDTTPLTTTDYIPIQTQRIEKSHKNKKLNPTQENELANYLKTVLPQIDKGDKGTLRKCFQSYFTNRNVQPCGDKWMYAFIKKNKELYELYFKGRKNRSHNEDMYRQRKKQSLQKLVEQIKNNIDEINDVLNEERDLIKLIDKEELAKKIEGIGSKY